MEQKRRNFRNEAVDDEPEIGKIASMTSTVKSNGHTVVPKKLRDRFKIKPGTTLDWQEDGNSIRVVKLSAAAKTRRGLMWLRRLGRVPAAPRDRRPVEYD